MIPDMLLTWVKTHIHSQVLFLLALNVLLLVLGASSRLLSDHHPGAAHRADGAAFGVTHSPWRHLPGEPELGFLFPRSA